MKYKTLLSYANPSKKELSIFATKNKVRDLPDNTLLHLWFVLSAKQLNITIEDLKYFIILPEAGTSRAWKNWKDNFSSKDLLQHRLHHLDNHYNVGIRFKSYKEKTFRYVALKSEED